VVVLVVLVVLVEPVDSAVLAVALVVVLVVVLVVAEDLVEACPGTSVATTTPRAPAATNELAAIEREISLTLRLALSLVRIAVR
jgi:hypothetical protein